MENLINFDFEIGKKPCPMTKLKRYLHCNVYWGFWSGLLSVDDKKFPCIFIELFVSRLVFFFSNFV